MNPFKPYNPFHPYDCEFLTDAETQEWTEDYHDMIRLN